jgi:hypothetical protein
MITITTQQAPATKVTQMLDLGIVFKAGAIVEVAKDWLTKSGNINP